jgi:hypothetical protein
LAPAIVKYYRIPARFDCLTGKIIPASAVRDDGGKCEEINTGNCVHFQPTPTIRKDGFHHWLDYMMFGGQIYPHPPEDLESLPILKS